MSDPVVFIDEKRVNYRRASISIFDYTLHCAVGLFESLLAVDDRLIYLDEHLDRMEAGRRQLGLKFNYNRRRIIRTLKAAVTAHPSRVKKVKVLLTYGYSPLWAGDKPKPRTIIIVADHRLQFKKQKLLISPMIINSANPMRGVKSVNFMNEWMSQHRAIEQGYDQGVILNQRGQVAETGSSNLFMVKNGRLITPPLDVGGLPGIVRQKIIEMAAANRLPCLERKLTPADLITANEVFTTSSFKLVWPVVQLKVDRVHKFKPGPVGRAFFDRLKKNFLTGIHEQEL